MASPPSDAHRLQRREHFAAAVREKQQQTTSKTFACMCNGTIYHHFQRLATELLSRVAVSNAAASSLLSCSPTSTRSFGIDASDKAAYHLDRELMQSNGYSSAGYFSFPSFDTWDVEQQDGDKSFDSTT
ncbi:hypothetical protein PG994_014170 [Apiospora phragmitis]|uniref:Uncharacterized protein n=1 Tax=Apiospora phragmitis TaxID=2905665 RepID=A0ABR1T5X4_9PEZI